MSANEATMREQLEEAFDKDPENDEEAGAGEQEAGGSEQDSEESVRLAAEEPEGEAGEEEGAGDNKDGDDEAGDVEEIPGEENDDKAGDSEEQDPGESSSSVAAPASWKPAAREAWAKVPAEAQREIQRREKHMDHMMRDSADARKHHTEFQELVRPFETLIAAQNSTPFKAVQSLMQTAAGLTIGTPTQKAQVVRNIIQQYGIDIEELDSALVGQPASAPANNGMQQMLQQELAPIRQFMGDMNTQRQSFQTNQENSINTEIDTFAADPKNEFFADVRENMADLMEMAANRNESMTIKQAYDTACRMDPDIHGITNKRQLAADAAANRKDIGKKRLAASSIHGNSAGDQSGQGADTLRGAIVDAWDDAV